MFDNATEIPKEQADAILERWDQTSPDLQRLAMLQLCLDNKVMKAALEKIGNCLYHDCPDRIAESALAKLGARR